jgi:hypothetical protein
VESHSRRLYVKHQPVFDLFVSQAKSAVHDQQLILPLNPGTIEWIDAIAGAVLILKTSGEIFQCQGDSKVFLQHFAESIVVLALMLAIGSERSASDRHSNLLSRRASLI